MAAKKNKNPFDMYNKEMEPKTAIIKALGDAEITYKKLPMGEEDALKLSMIEGYDDKGKPILDKEGYVDMKYKKVSLALVEPKMSVEELKALPESASAAIDEIMELITDEKDETEGNES